MSNMMDDIIDLVSSDSSLSLHHCKFYLSTPGSSSSSSSSLSSISDEDDEFDSVDIVDLSSEDLFSSPKQSSEKNFVFSSNASRGSGSTTLLLRRVHYKERSRNIRCVVFLVLSF